MINLQFATYSLLIAFFVSNVYRETWSSHVRRRVAILYVAANGLLAAFTLGWIIAAGDRPESDASDALIDAQIIFSGIVFLVLTLAMAYFGWMYISLLDSNQVKGKSLGLPTGATSLHVKVFYCLALVRAPPARAARRARGGLTRRAQAIFSFRYVWDFTGVNVDWSTVPFGVVRREA